MNLTTLFSYGVVNNDDTFLILDDYSEIYHTHFEIRKHQPQRYPTFWVGTELLDEIENEGR